MVNRKTPEQIKSDILDFLFEGPKGINEIAIKLDSNWPTTNSYLEKLKEEGLVNELLATDKMKVFRRTDDPVYFSIPFSKEIRIKTLYLLSEIEKEWKVKRKTDLSKTTLQKIAVDVIKSCNLKLPILNFHYGLTTCASLDSANKDIMNLIDKPEDNLIILKGIQDEIKNEKHTGRAYEEREYQYEKYNLPFYLSKERLSRLFVIQCKCKEPNKDINEEIQKKLLDLALNYPLKLERFYPDFEKFINNSMIILLNKKSEAQNLEIIRGTFNQLWDKLTTFTSFKDSEEFIDNKDKPLFEHIRDLNLNFKEMTYKLYIEELESKAQATNPFEIRIPEGDSANNIQELILEGLENEK